MRSGTTVGGCDSLFHLLRNGYTGYVLHFEEISHSHIIKIGGYEDECVALHRRAKLRQYFVLEVLKASVRQLSEAVTDHSLEPLLDLPNYLLNNANSLLHYSHFSNSVYTSPLEGGVDLWSDTTANDNSLAEMLTPTPVSMTRT